MNDLCCCKILSGDAPDLRCTQGEEYEVEDTLFEDLGDTADEAGDTLKNWAVIIGGSVGGGVAVCLLVSCTIYCLCCR